MKYVQTANKKTKSMTLLKKRLKIFFTFYSVKVLRPSGHYVYLKLDITCYILVTAETLAASMVYLLSVYFSLL